jgi:hypothetical protein
MKTVLALSLIAVLTGCMSTGVEVSQEQTASFKTGSTTQQDVVTRLGPPTSRTTMPDGSQVMVYSFAASQARAASFIPIVGAFVGGADSRASTVMFQFAPDGTLKATTRSDSAMGSRMGTVTTAAPMATAQPVAAK